MRERKSLWTDEETAKARILLARNAPPEQFLAEINRTKSAAQSRRDYLDNPNCRQRKAESVKRSRAKCKQGIPQRYTNRIDRYVPDDVLADADKRANAPRTITGWFCGDPAPGFSALDRRA